MMTREMMEARLTEVKELKRMKEELEQEISAAERDIIAYMQDHEECATTDKKGVEFLQYNGTLFKATYKPQSRESVDKDAVKNLLTSEQYEDVRKVSTYNVLRVS